MTHIVNPFSHRLGIIRDWRSRWFVGPVGKTAFKSALKADVLLREFLEKELRGNYVGEIIIQRNKGELSINIQTARPGMLIGRSGDGVEKLRKAIMKFSNSKKLNIPVNFKLDITEISSAESNASVVSQMVSEGLEKRLPFRRVLKGTVEKAMSNRDVKGIRISISGRLGGADMARKEEIRKGNVPLQTLRADVDFAREKAFMTYGVIGIKVWIYRGMKFSNKQTDIKELYNLNNNNSPRNNKNQDNRDRNIKKPRISRPRVNKEN